MKDTLNYRCGDPQTSNRNDDERYFSVKSQWYFTTREGITMGPYGSKALAVAETSSYIDFINGAKTPIINVLKRAQSTVNLEAAKN